MPTLYPMSTFDSVWQVVSPKSNSKRMQKSFSQEIIISCRLKKLEVKYGVYSNSFIKQRLKNCKLGQIEKIRSIYTSFRVRLGKHYITQICGRTEDRCGLSYFSTMMGDLLECKIFFFSLNLIFKLF